MFAYLNYFHNFKKKTLPRILNVNQTQFLKIPKNNITYYHIPRKLSPKNKQMQPWINENGQHLILLISELEAGWGTKSKVNRNEEKEVYPIGSNNL